MRLVGGAQGLVSPPPLILAKKRRNHRRKKSDSASKTKQNHSTSPPPPPPLSSRSGSASDLSSKTEFVGLANNKLREVIQFLNIEVCSNFGFIVIH